MDNSNLLILYDIDSVLWPLEERVARGVGVDVPTVTFTYNYYKNPKLSHEQKEQAIRIVSDAKTFADIDFFPGIENIMKPCECGAEVGIITNSLTSEISATKIEQLLAAVPGLKPEHITARITGLGDFKKSFPTNRPLVVVEDSPYSVSHSPAKVNVLRTLGWNSSPEAVEVMTGKNVVWLPTLSDINEYVYAYAKKFTRIQNISK